MRPVFEATRHPDFGSAYPFALSADRKGLLEEGGRVRFSWNEKGLYVFAELEDSTPVALSSEDEQLHYETGDVLELFLKPLHAPYKWEMYVTPNGNKSTLFFPVWPCELPVEECLTNHRFHGLEVSVQKSARGWNANMFVPVAQLTALGEGWGDGTAWTVFCGRYNYRSEDLANPELSMAPALSSTNYHLDEEYARLELADIRTEEPAARPVVHGQAENVCRK
jgi:hypothetical protein